VNTNFINNKSNNSAESSRYKHYDSNFFQDEITEKDHKFAINDDKTQLDNNDISIISNLNSNRNSNKNTKV